MPLWAGVKRATNIEFNNETQTLEEKHTHLFSDVGIGLQFFKGSPQERASNSKLIFPPEREHTWSEGKKLERIGVRWIAWARVWNAYNGGKGLKLISLFFIVFCGVVVVVLDHTARTSMNSFFFDIFSVFPCATGHDEHDVMAYFRLELASTRVRTAKWMWQSHSYGFRHFSEKMSAYFIVTLVGFVEICDRLEKKRK